MTEHFRIKVSLSKNIAFILDEIIGIEIGIFLYFKFSELTLKFVGIGFVLIGLIQLVRKIKTFHLTKTDLIIKRPLFPFIIATENYPLNEIKEIKFNKIKGRFGGSHLIVDSKNKSSSFRIETTKDNIDKFELELKKLNIKSIRIGM
ncbi:hypothetical protein HNV08_16105 [Winogradskyella eckloniae]|uniref:hypothetical protein n=1 Tax=Winogradskyella eckloniae TaxID=1089306 RepID=UPI001563C81E|nr:hypothetical protein [Winogradskyella eckloniae]NRD21579.1 hypothetical protein [Winogradskyella eckloniae]